jgi:kumamolisin
MNRAKVICGIAVSRGQALAIGLVLVLLLGLPARAQQHSMLTHQLRQVVASKHAQFISPLPETQRLKLAIMLPPSDQTGLDAFLKQVYDPQSPSYRQFLSVPLSPSPKPMA